jgi:predicted Zn-dependent peptidase
MDIYKESLNSSQGKICIGLRADCRQQGECYTSMLLLNEILGGGSNSKLFVNLREKESLCYYVNSVYYRFKSIIVIQCGVASENFDKAIELSLLEVDKLKNGEITETEWENAKMSLINKFRGGQDYPAATIDFYMVQHLLGDPDELDDVIEKIRGATIEDMVGIAKTLYADAAFQLE